MSIKPIKIIKTYFIKGVKFEISLEEYVSIRKHQEDFTLDTHLFHTKCLESEYSSTPEEITKAWETTKPISPTQAIKKFHNNSQQLMTVFSILGAESTMKVLKSKIIDSQTISKTQTKTFIKEKFSINFGEIKTKDSPWLDSEIFETKEVSYEDKYTLYEMDPSIFENDIQLDNPIYILQVECPSTHQYYYIFVDANHPQCQDAIGAVAWTMIKDNGEHLTRQEYINLQSET